MDTSIVYIPSAIVNNEIIKPKEPKTISVSVADTNGTDKIWPSYVPELTNRNNNIDVKNEETEPTFSPPDSENHSEVEENSVLETKETVDTISMELESEEKSISKDKSKSSSNNSSSRHRHKSSSHSRSHTSSSSSKHKSSSDKHRRSSSSSHKSSKRDSISSKDTDRQKHDRSSDSKSKSSSKSSSHRSDKNESSSSKSNRSSSSKSSSSTKKESYKKENKEKESQKVEVPETPTFDIDGFSPSSIFDTDSSDEDEIMKQCRMIFEEFQNKPPAESNHIKKEKKSSRTSTEEASKLQEVNLFDESNNKKKRVAHESNNLPVRKLPAVVPKPNHVQNAMQSIYLRQQSMLRKAEEEQKEKEKIEAAETASATTSSTSTFKSPSPEVFKPQCKIIVYNCHFLYF